MNVTNFQRIADEGLPQIEPAVLMIRTTRPDKRKMAKRLSEQEYLAGAYTVADIATFPWVARYEWHQVDLPDFPHVKRWFDAIVKRPAVQRGMGIPPDA